MTANNDLTALYETAIAAEVKSPEVRRVLTNLVRRSARLQAPVTLIFSKERGTLEIGREVLGNVDTIRREAGAQGSKAVCVTSEWNFHTPKNANSKVAPEPDSAMLVFYPEGVTDAFFDNVYDPLRALSDEEALPSPNDAVA